MGKSNSTLKGGVYSIAWVLVAMLSLSPGVFAQTKPQKTGKNTQVIQNNDPNDINNTKKQPGHDVLDDDPVNVLPVTSPSPVDPVLQQPQQASPSPAEKKQDTQQQQASPSPVKQEPVASPSPVKDDPTLQQQNTVKKKDQQNTNKPTQTKPNTKPNTKPKDDKSKGKNNSSSSQKNPPPKKKTQGAHKSGGKRVRGTNPTNNAQNNQQDPNKKVGVNGEKDDEELQTKGNQTSLIEGNEEEQVGQDNKKTGAGIATPDTFKKPCEDEALRKIYEFVLQDKGNALAEMFELSALRLAKRSVDGAETTVEDRVKNDIGMMEKRLGELKGSKDVQDAVSKIYQAYGLPADATAIQNDLDAVLEKGKDACYWAKKQRLENNNASAYILAVTAGEKDSGLSEIDAATVWVVDKMRANAGADYAYGTKNGNLLNISVRAARYMGRIHGGVKMDADALKKEIDERMTKLEAAFNAATQSVEKGLKDCITKRNNSCPTCDAKDLAEWKERTKVEDLQKGLLQAVAKSDDAKMVEDLKARMGDVTFDFSNYARGNGIPVDKRRGKFDACGKPLKQRGTSGQTQQQLQQRTVKHITEPGSNQQQTIDFQKTPQQQVPADGTFVDKKVPLDRLPNQVQKLTPGQEAKLQKDMQEWQKVSEEWSADNSILEGTHYNFDQESFLRWKPRMQVWSQNHEGRKPPPNDPLYAAIADPRPIKLYKRTNPNCETEESMKNDPKCKDAVISDLHCKGADLYGGNKLQVGKNPYDDTKTIDYRFASPGECLWVIHTYGVLHKPHGSYK